MRSLSSRKVPSTDGLSRDECGSCRASGVFIGEAFEALGFFSLVAVLWIVASDQVVEIDALQRIFLHREVFVGAQVVNPQLSVRGFSAAGLRSKTPESAGSRERDRKPERLSERERTNQDARRH
jgi:hypothetical protein